VSQPVERAGVVDRLEGDTFGGLGQELLVEGGSLERRLGRGALCQLPSVLLLALSELSSTGHSRTESYIVY